MSFPLGRPILAMVFLALLSGTIILLRHTPPRKDLLAWTFSSENQEVYQPLLAPFEHTSHASVDLQLINITALNHSLLSDFTNGQTGVGSPDVAEIEISNVGKFFRPPLDEIGFEPIEPYLRKSNLYDRLLPARLATWRKHGVLFGIPHDVHPVGLLYRADLFEEAGVDLPAATTWPAFVDAALRFQNYWRGKGFATRHAIEFHRSTPEELIILLQQRGINVIDDSDHVHLADRKVANTIAFYVECLIGNRNISSESAGEGPFLRDLQAGNLCAFLAADWRIDKIRQYGGPALAGKLRLMSLPRFDPTDAPTATYGGTMIVILKSSIHKEQAWHLIQQLYFSPEALARQRAMTHILPAQPGAWLAPEYAARDPYFDNQPIDQQLISLARQIPARYATPATTLAGHYLTQVLARAIDRFEQQGEIGLESAIQKWLDEAAVDLSQRVQHLTFD